MTRGQQAEILLRAEQSSGSEKSSKPHRDTGKKEQGGEVIRGQCKTRANENEKQTTTTKTPGKRQAPLKGEVHGLDWPVPVRTQDPVRCPCPAHSSPIFTNSICGLTLFPSPVAVTVWEFPGHSGCPSEISQPLSVPRTSSPENSLGLVIKMS